MAPKDQREIKIGAIKEDATETELKKKMLRIKFGKNSHGLFLSHKVNVPLKADVSFRIAFGTVILLS